MKVIITGAGIGGLATALSLHAGGIGVEVFEAVNDVHSLGVGINLQPNAIRELGALGLGDALAETAIETSTLAYFNKHGQMIWSEPRGRAAGYDWPQYAIHRGELQLMLLRLVQERIGRGHVHLGHRLVSVDQDDQSVTAHFEGADRRPLESCVADALVGADGIHSTVRRTFYPDESEPVFSGRIMWRGAVEAEPILDGRTMIVLGHREHRTVVYPISRRHAEAGGSLVNWLVILGHQQADNTRESWNREVSKERFFDRFAGWNFGWLNLADLIAETKEIFEYPKVDRDPLPRWTFGRVTLLGDAAHPMRPIGSQAGTQAIIDARVLAQQMVTLHDVRDGLKAYEAIRLEPMNQVVLRNREFGPEIVMQMAEERAPDGFTDIHDIIPQTDLEEIAYSYKREAGFDPETVNSSPDLSVDPVRADVHLYN